MTDKLLTPKFLTPAIAARAAQFVFDAVLGESGIASMVKQKRGHVVVVVPAIKDLNDDKMPAWLDTPVQPHILFEQGFNCSPEETDFEEIARSKAMQLWYGFNDDRTDCMPHLLFSSETPFWGGVKRHGIVVAFSGVQSYFDKMISGMIADMCIALAYHEWKNSQDRADDKSFLS